MTVNLLGLCVPTFFLHSSGRVTENKEFKINLYDLSISFLHLFKRVQRNKVMTINQNGLRYLSSFRFQRVRKNRVMPVNVPGLCYIAFSRLPILRISTKQHNVTLLKFVICLAVCLGRQHATTLQQSIRSCNMHTKHLNERIFHTAFVKRTKVNGEVMNKHKF